MKISKRFATDHALEEDGTWFDIGDGGQLKVARKNNRRFKQKMRELIRGKERQLQLNTLPEEVADDILLEAMSHTILVDWKGIEDEADKPMRYSVARAKESMKAHPDFRELVEALSDDMEAFRVKQTASTEKNSVSASGSSST